ncbi:MAG TPA: hypothetical protein VKV26_06000 [Dehalococcoidia bacterium]|nr:hypothetical protein [Dehalococcoidia bacterium]
MLKFTVTRADCHVEFDWFNGGSVLAGTVEAGATACRTRLEIDSPEPEAAIVHLIRLAQQGCYAEQLVQTPVPLSSTCIVNGREIEPPGAAAT